MPIDPGFRPTVRLRRRAIDSWTPFTMLQRATETRGVLMSVVVSAVAPAPFAEMFDGVSSRVMPGDQLPDGCQLHIAGPV
jgi:hypothetical protein